jgi:hypothetical protein
VLGHYGNDYGGIFGALRFVSRGGVSRLWGAKTRSGPDSRELTKERAAESAVVEERGCARADSFRSRADSTSRSDAGMSTPTVRTLSASALSGQTAAAPPSTAMNSRRLIRSPRRLGGLT